jgi:hypothetical protein
MSGADEDGPAAPTTIGDVIGQRLLTALEAQEEKLDQEIHKLEAMDEDEIERLRRSRMDQMRKLQSQRAEWLSHGHGEYREVQDQKRFFEELKPSPRAVVHFYRPSTRRCEIFDKHLSILARKHVETKFLRVNAEKSPFLTERLKIWMLPTVVLIRDGKTDHSIIGFDELGGNDDFSTELLENILLKYGIVLESFC